MLKDSLHATLSLINCSYKLFPSCISEQNEYVILWYGWKKHMAANKIFPLYSKLSAKFPPLVWVCVILLNI